VDVAVGRNGIVGSGTGRGYEGTCTYVVTRSGRHRWAGKATVVSCNTKNI
jgi:hypothetical protein